MSVSVKVAAAAPQFVDGVEAPSWTGSRTINVPGTVQAGDLGFILHGVDQGTASTAVNPAGWTAVGPDFAAGNSNWRLLTRVRQAGDAATIAFTGITGGTVVAFWYRNVTLGAVGTWWKRSATSFTITAPAVARTAADSLILAIGGDRAIAATEGEKGYASVTGGTYVRRYDGDPTLNSGTNICGSIYAEIAPGQPQSDVTFTMNDSSSNAFGVQVELVPNAGWRTVTQPHIKVAGAWKQAAVMAVRAGWPERYTTVLLPPNILKAPTLWTVPYGYTKPTVAVEGAAMRLSAWTVSAGSSVYCGPSVPLTAGRTYNVSITCSSAVGEWEAVCEGTSTVGNRVAGAGTSSFSFTAASSATRIVGIKVFDSAVGGAGHLVSSITVTDQNPPSLASNTDVPFPWKQVWPDPGVGSPKITGVRKELATESYGFYYVDLIRYNTVGHFLNSKFSLPPVPFYRVIGDTSQIASAKVTLRFTPVAPKSPVEHTISWDAPVGWALYHVAYMGDDGYTHFYYAALTDAEATTLRGQANRYVTKMWSPKEGGWFVWMPVCWDVSGVTVPMRSEVAQEINSGLDPYSGYTPFPPNVSATSALADYTVANGYSDMASWSIAYTAITIELKNSGGTVLHSWTGSLPANYFPDVPGRGSGAAVLASDPETEPVSDILFYWPEEWRGLFDNVERFGNAYSVRWGRDVPNKGEGEWYVFDHDGNRVGDFRLAMRYGNPGIIEIRGVNLQPDLVGLQIMRTIVDHGVQWCPTEDVIITPPDEVTYQVMRSWGWQEMSDLSPLSLVVLPREYRESLGRSLYIRSDPMYNRFTELGFPSWQETFRA